MYNPGSVYVGDQLWVVTAWWFDPYFSFFLNFKFDLHSAHAQWFSWRAVFCARCLEGQYRCS